MNTTRRSFLQSLAALCGVVVVPAVPTPPAPATPPAESRGLSRLDNALFAGEYKEWSGSSIVAIVDPKTGQMRFRRYSQDRQTLTLGPEDKPA